MLVRGHWPLGKITKTFPGDDGAVRVVEVKTKNSVLRRPIHKLCMLEEATIGDGVTKDKNTNDED
jgi:hypothetical protein